MALERQVTFQTNVNNTIDSEINKNEGTMLYIHVCIHIYKSFSDYRFLFELVNTN